MTHGRFAAAIAALLFLTSPIALAALHIPPFRGLAPGLSDGRGSAPLFQVANMQPGNRVSRCISLSGHDATAAAIRLYATGGRQKLDRFLDLIVERVTGTGGCAQLRRAGTGPLFSGQLANYPHTSGHAVIDRRPLAPGARRTYRFTVVLRDDQRAEGLRSGATFRFHADAPRRGAA